MDGVGCGDRHLHGLAHETAQTFAESRGSLFRGHVWTSVSGVEIGCEVDGRGVSLASVWPSATGSGRMFHMKHTFVAGWRRRLRRSRVSRGTRLKDGVCREAQRPGRGQ